MNDEYRYWKILVYVMGILMIFIIAASAFIIISLEPENYKTPTIANISLSVMGIIITSIIFVGCAIDKSRVGRSQNAFTLVLFFETVALFSTIACAYVNGKPEYLWMNVISNFLYYECTIILASLFWFYISYQKDEYYRDLTFYLIIAAMILGSLLLLSNLFAGFLYTFDESGYYVRGNIYPSFVAPFFIILIAIFWTFLKTDSFIQKIVMVVFLILVLVAESLQFYFPGYQLMYTCALLIIIMFYSNIYIKRGYMLAELDAELNNQRHAVMVSQIRPHFLYNVLNTIASLDDASSMRNAIGLFGRYLRGNLDTLTITDAIPFTKELDHVKTYVALESIRFESKLTIEYDLRELDFLVPPLSIQVLVENAIRYGISRRPDGGWVKIETFSDEKNYRIIVSDNGIGFDASNQQQMGDAHSGIDNTRKRIQDMVGGKLDIFSEAELGTTASITIPRKAKSSFFSKYI